MIALRILCPTPVRVDVHRILAASAPYDPFDSKTRRRTREQRGWGRLPRRLGESGDIARFAVDPRDGRPVDLFELCVLPSQRPKQPRL